MVDKALFIGSNSAKNSMSELEIITNNLANSNTTGFRADFQGKSQVNTKGKKNNGRTYAVADKTYTNFTHGPTINTGRDLDVAIAGEGFLTVQSKTGKEGYTRAGDLQLKNGFLMTQAGQLVVGTTGVVTIPSLAQRVNIGSDGTVSVLMKGAPDMITLNRLKLTNPEVSKLQKGEDGLFYAVGNTTVKADDKIVLTAGALEGSNVNPVEQLTDLIELSRSFEMHSNMMRTFQQDAGKANEILSLDK